MFKSNLFDSSIFKSDIFIDNLFFSITGLIPSFYDIPSLPAFDVRLKASDLSLNDNDSVVQWDARAGSVIAEQLTASNQGTYKANVYNGNPTVRFDKANSQFMQMKATSGKDILKDASEYAYFVVMKNNVASSDETVFAIYDNNGTDTRFRHYRNASNREGWYIRDNTGAIVNESTGSPGTVNNTDLYTTFIHGQQLANDSEVKRRGSNAPDPKDKWYLLDTGSMVSNNTENSDIGNMFIGGDPNIVGSYHSADFCEIGLIKNDSSFETMQNIFAYTACEYYSDISILKPYPYEVIKYNGEATNISLNGYYKGNPGKIQARFDGGDWVDITDTLPASVEPTGFTGVLQSQTGIQGDLEVRFSNDNLITYAQPYIGLGYVLMLDGQSNTDGRVTNRLDYTDSFILSSMNNSGAIDRVNYTGHWNLNGFNRLNRDIMPDTDWAAGRGGGGYTYWVPMADLITQVKNRPIMFVINAKGGQSIDAWDLNDNPVTPTSLYGTLWAKYNLLQNGANLLLRHQGETDAGATASLYQDKFNNFCNAVAADMSGLKTMQTLLQDSLGVPGQPTIPGSAPAWVDLATYAEHDLSEYNSVIYYCKIGYTAAGVTPDNDTTHWLPSDDWGEKELNDGVTATVASNDNTDEGPTLADTKSDDDFHLLIDSKANTAASRWATKLNAEL